MANWYGTARSNYFRVRDEAGFLAWVETIPELVAQKTDDGDEQTRKFWLCVGQDSDSGGWPSYREPGEGQDEPQELDLCAELAAFLADGEVAVLMEIGAEKVRYLTGFAVAVHSSGKITRVDLDDIYALAAKTFRKRKADICLAEF